MTPKQNNVCCKYELYLQHKLFCAKLLFQIFTFCLVLYIHSSPLCNCSANYSNFLFFLPMRGVLSILLCTGNLSSPCMHCWVINPPIWAEMLNVLVWLQLDKSLGLKKNDPHTIHGISNTCVHCGRVTF